ncbi:Imm15 family immunity protein [Pectobacterium cacticida]|uniref:Imm15 family immunity protein n=1 Tax=Pectobacterium cacticida TaxID=69221 RepID=A0ABZ2GH90_9GAMM|nr:Imm15 family immunity protein [Pectobacterium cacticida]UYX05588.1 Imm15 family immunity protein [Pectobacterium cacticida]
MKNEFDAELEFLMEKEELNNSSLYLRHYQDFEEIPLFSRFENISFLDSLSFDEKNKILIKKGIELIDNILDLVKGTLSGSDFCDYFLCLTLTDIDDCHEINCFTPNLFISRRKTWLLHHLNLIQKNTAEENLIQEYLNSMEMKGYTVLVSSSYSEDNKRIYIMRKVLNN